MIKYYVTININPSQSQNEIAEYFFVTIELIQQPILLTCCL
jgi:hypothetical protein